MPIVAGDWSVDRATGNIRYIGDDHVRFGGATPSYATVIEFHRWLADLADDASFAGNDELDITDNTPSERATDNLITLINGYNIDALAAEHLYDGSIVQAGGADIWDGIVNFGNSDILIQLIQNGAVLADDWWNTASGGLNASAAAGISHRFMIKTRTAGTDIDGRRLIGTARRFGKSYQEFSINGTSRGNNVLALADANDLNNATAEGTVSGWSGIANLTQGYVGINVNNIGGPEYFYSQWNKDVYSINQLYERMKWLTRDGSSETLYGLNGELFRGITHEIALSGTNSGTFSAFEAVSWSGGTGQMLAIDNTTASSATKMWIQLLTGVAPTNSQLITGGGSAATATASGTATERPISKPFCGQSTGSAIIGAYGFGIEYADLTNNDLLLALDNLTYQPPNNVTFTVFGLVADEDRILVGPETGGLLNYAQFTLNGALTTAGVTSVVVNGSIPNDTPSSGTIRIERADGLYSLHPYSAWSGSTFTITSHDFSSNNAANGADVFISYLDALADSTPIAATALTDGVEYIITTQGTTVWTNFGASSNTVGTIFTMSGGPGTGTGFAKPRSTSASFTVVYSSPRSLFIRARDGGTTGDGAGIKTFETTGTLGSGGGSTTVIRTPDV
jgi:hypothetical protein